jgi:hypothetical protein
MIKRFYALFLLVSVSATLPLHAGRAGESVGWGMLGGFVGGTLGGALANRAAANNNPPPVYVVEDPYADQKRMELHAREHHIRSRELEQRRREREEEIQRQQEYYAQQQAERNRRLKKMHNNMIVENTVVETRTIAHPRPKDKGLELRERELALKEQQIELALVKERKELLKEQNRKKELELKEKELDLKLVKARDTAHGVGVERTVTRRISKREINDDDPLSLIS